LRKITENCTYSPLVIEVNYKGMASLTPGRR